MGYLGKNVFLNGKDGKIMNSDAGEVEPVEREKRPVQRVNLQVWPREEVSRKGGR